MADMLGSQGKRVRYPGHVPAGRTSDVLFTHVDFAPTLLSLCGVRALSAMQGADLSRVLLGQTEAGPPEAFLQIFGLYQGDGTDDGWRGLRTRRYTYVRYESKPWVLYDLERDPYQMNNLVGERSAAALQRSLDEKLSNWIRKTGDAWSNNWH